MLITTLKHYWALVRAHHRGDPDALGYLKILSHGVGKEAQRARQFCLSVEQKDKVGS